MAEDLDADLEEMDLVQLKAEVLKIRTAIRTLRDATGHQLCWYVPELWNTLPEKVLPHPEVPPLDEFLAKCSRYHTTLPEFVATLSRPNVPKFVCPKCGATHHRGFLDGVQLYRCLKCGYQGDENDYRS